MKWGNKMNQLIGIALLCLVTLIASMPVHAERNDVLVITNDNSVDSIKVGMYYAEQRGIAVANVVHIKSPNQYFISWAQFQSLRDQILRFGICPSVPLDRRPVACTDTTQPIYTEANVSALTAATPIRYIVMTRGVPTIFQIEPNSSYDPFPPVDNYLRFWLARYFSTDTQFGSFKEREKSFGDGSLMRNILPAQDREYAIGRLDGVNLSSTIGLIDRTISAEQNGIFGKLFGSAGGDGGLGQWTDHRTGTSIYPGEGAPWRYLLGTFDESRPECSAYASSNHYFAFAQNSIQGHAPEHCLAQFQKGSPNELPPAHPSSRHPLPENGLIYIGSLDGQTLPGGFSQLLNWRREKGCITLCAQTPDPAACRANSIDAVKEINTSCVGVAPGFIGYQHQSFPLSYLGIWPTGWTSLAGGGQQMDVPRVDSSRGYDDSFSLWYDRTDETANAQCYGYTNGVLDTTLQPCKSNRFVSLRNMVGITGVNSASPPSYMFQFRYRTESIPIATGFTSRVTFIYPKAAGVICPFGLIGATTDSECSYSSAVNNAVTAGSSVDWILANQQITPPSNTVGLNYTTIRVEFTGTLPGGNLGFDTVTLTDVGTNVQLLTNSSFSEGHRQTNAGDHAALFLGRLGGAAFWGSTSHHFTGGHAFERNALETLIYFMRGLPLGEAVWFDDDSETGLLYGDPIYSPSAVRINPLNTWNYIVSNSAHALFGSTINGRGPLVATNYSVHYCNGSDFYLCGTLANPWISTGIENQPGKFANQSLGMWNTANLPVGKYTLRLAVTSNSAGKSQTFNDYLPLTITTPTADFDGDGLSDMSEIDTYKTNPNLADTDGDQLSDSQEVLILQTNPNNPDSNGNGIGDGSEDPDGDGYGNAQEFRYGGDPLNAMIVPLAFTGLPVPPGFYVETGIPFSLQFQSTWSGATFKFPVWFEPPPGMSLTLAGMLTWTPSNSQSGYAGIFVELHHPNLSTAVQRYLFFSVNPGNTGDINEDGMFDVADVALLQRHLLGLSAFTPRQTVRADLAPVGLPDGVLDVSDMQALHRRALELK